jgi:hypothetical protein
MLLELTQKVLEFRRRHAVPLRTVTDFPNANLPDLPRAQVEPLLEIALANLSFSSL